MIKLCLIQIADNGHFLPVFVHFTVAGASAWAKLLPAIASLTATGPAQTRPKLDAMTALGRPWSQPHRASDEQTNANTLYRAKRP